MPTEHIVIIASLYQMPVDPFEQVSTHRPLDYWGRNLIDHLISLLPVAVADDGVAYVMQLSIIGQQRTALQLEALGYQSRVLDFAFFEFHELFEEKSEQIARVEEHSDAYRAEGAAPVKIDRKAIERLGVRVRRARLPEAMGAEMRHDPERLALAVREIAAAR